MNSNDLLNPTLTVIVNDTELNNITDEMKAAKGPRKPSGWNECFTLHIPSNPRNPDTKIHNGTLNINYYCPNYPSGNANAEKHGAVVAQLIKILDDKPPDINGYRIADWSVKEPFGPIPVQGNEDEESFSTVRIGFRVQKVGD